MGKTIKTFGQAIIIIYVIVGIIALMVFCGNPLLATGRMAIGVVVGIVLTCIIIGLPLMAFGEMMMNISDIKILLMAIAKNEGITNSNNDELLQDMKIYTGMLDETISLTEKCNESENNNDLKVNRGELLEHTYRNNLRNIYVNLSREELQKIYVDLNIMISNKEAALKANKNSDEEEKYLAYVVAQREVMDMTKGREWVYGINGENRYVYPVWEDIDAAYVKELLDKM